MANNILAMKWHIVICAIIYSNKQALITSVPETMPNYIWAIRVAHNINALAFRHVNIYAL